MKKTYSKPALTASDCLPARIFAVSDVNSNADLIGPGGAGSGVIQRARRYDDWAQTQWATPTEE